MKIRKVLLLNEGPVGVPFTPQTFIETFNGVLAGGLKVLGGERGALLTAEGGIFVEVRPANEGANVMVWGFNPDKQGADMYGRWHRANIFTDPNLALEFANKNLKYGLAE